VLLLFNCVLVYMQLLGMLQEALTPCAHSLFYNTERVSDTGLPWNEQGSHNKY
jgi:hypothetical protein